MMSNYNKLCEISDIVDSLHKTPKYSEEGTPMVRCTDVKYGRLKLEDTFRVNNAVYEEFSRRYKPNKDDIIITRVGSYGITALVGNANFCLGQNTAAIISKINPRYLYLALNSPQIKKQIEFSVVGSTQKTLSLKAISNLEIPRFDEETENKIAVIVGGLDNKIELNRQTNQTLEQIAQAIFKSWFVDFEPVKAKAQVRARVAQGYLPNSDQSTPPLPKNFDVEAAVERAAMCAISGKSLEELEQLSDETLQQLKTTAALFPDALIESELGEIPEGWGVQKIEDVLDLAYGKALKKTERIDGKYPVYGSGGLTGMHNKCLVEGPGIIIGRKGSVGKLYWEDKSFYPIDTVFYVKCKNSMTLPFSYYMLQILGLEDMNTDAAVPGLNRNNAYRLEIPKYSNNLVEEFTNIASNIRKKIKLVRKEINTLETIRVEWQPKLLSGDLDINNAA